MMMPSIFGNNFVDDVFDDMFPFAGNYTTANYDLMKTDVKDAGDHYELEMEMPGVEKENIKAELKDGYLTVTAQQNTNKDEKDKEGNYGILTVAVPKEVQKPVEEKQYITIE